MARLHVEGWAPEYGASVEPEDALSPAEGSVDVDVEDRPWEPIAGIDDGIPLVAFVDGVRRIDARLLLDDPSGPVPGICGSFAAGAVVWDRRARRSEITVRVIERMAVLGDGHAPELPPLPAWLSYVTASVPDDDPASLIRAFHDSMRRAEAMIAEELADAGQFVVADGPLYEYTRNDKMGYVKSHRRSYLPDATIVGLLPASHRTPLFTIGEGRFRRYSWYVRLTDRGDDHSWAGIVRCEASGALDRASVVAIADRSAAILPMVGSEPHIDPRAPQNLVPIAALERDLRHRLGDAGLVLRALRTALAKGAA
ncbi:MAG TPA: hypothetical protein VJP05_03075 [Acidimicrobiia bacterium]|nr:hypothetical protein [Acidimicrobiia bacterium]